MPLHDRTDERGWDSVHPFWLAYLVEWIQPRLPEGYKAFLGGVPALTVASGNGKPDFSVRQGGTPPVAERVATETVVLEPDAENRVVIRLDPQLAVHVDFHGQLIAAIELVSPRNKDALILVGFDGAGRVARKYFTPNLSGPPVWFPPDRAWWRFW